MEICVEQIDRRSQFPMQEMDMEVHSFRDDVALHKSCINKKGGMYDN